MGWCFFGGWLIVWGCALLLACFVGYPPASATDWLILLACEAFCWGLGALMVRRGLRVSKATPQDWAMAAERQRLAEEQERLRQQELAKKELVRERAERTLTQIEHTDGLPLAPGAQCSIFYNLDEDSNRLEISGGGNTFRLALDKICDIALKTDVEIQKQYVSSVGGAVGGYMLFGGLGAMIGGRAKERETTKTEYYLIITYRKNDELAYISFKADDQRTAERFVEIVSNKLTHETAPAVVDL